MHVLSCFGVIVSIPVGFFVPAKTDNHQQESGVLLPSQVTQIEKTVLGTEESVFRHDGSQIRRIGIWIEVEFRIDMKGRFQLTDEGEEKAFALNIHSERE